MPAFQALKRKGLFLIMCCIVKRRCPRTRTRARTRVRARVRDRDRDRDRARSAKSVAMCFMHKPRGKP